MDRVDDGSCKGKLHAAADAGRATGPAGVDEPDLSAVLADFLGEEFSVLAGMPYQERAAEARAERRLRLGHADFSAGDLRRVANDEVEHRLFGSQLRDWRQHAKGVASQKDHVAGMPGHARNLGVGHVADWVG